MNFEKIKALILKSSISESDKQALITLYRKANDGDLRETLDLFEKNPGWIAKMSESYKAKQKAFTSGDDIAWAKIIKAEEAELRVFQ